MAENIDFPIIIPTRNRAAQIASCLDAIAAIRYPRSRFEVVVVDDGSRPPVEPIVASRRDRMTIILRRQPCGGPARARDEGARVANGRFLAFTDDDCRPAPDWLDALAGCLESAPGSIVGGRTINGLGHNIFAAASQELIAYMYDYFDCNPGKSWFLTSNNMALTAELFRSVSGFDPSFQRAAAEDRELCERLRARGVSMVQAPAAVVHHLHSLTLTSFWRQHLEYGRGACRFHRARRARKGAAIRVEPLGFYSGIVVWPFRSPGIRNPFMLSGLLVLSQIANAAGFFLQSASENSFRRRRGE
jgi:GT2 family glycosyltransferase